MRRFVIAALVAAAAWTGVPAANAVCAHSHGSQGPHVHSGTCDSCASAAADGVIPECVGLGADTPLDNAVCALATVTNTGLVEC